MPLPVLVVLMIYIMLRYARRFLYPNSIFGTALPSLFFENNSFVRYITVQKVVEKNARKKVFGTTENRYQMRWVGYTDTVGTRVLVCYNIDIWYDILYKQNPEFVSHVSCTMLWYCHSPDCRPPKDDDDDDDDDTNHTEYTEYTGRNNLNHHHHWIPNINLYRIVQLARKYDQLVNIRRS